MPRGWIGAVRSVGGGVGFSGTGTSCGALAVGFAVWRSCGGSRGITASAGSVAMLAIGGAESADGFPIELGIALGAESVTDWATARPTGCDAAGALLLSARA